VRRNSKSSSSRPHRKRRGGWRWLLALAMLATVAWFWGRHEPPTKIVRAPTKAVAPRLRPLIVDPESPAGFPRPVRDGFEAQVALARRGISPGSIDAATGSQTRKAISVFQEIQNLPQTGLLDTNTCARLTLAAPPVTTYVVTTNDLARLQPLGKTWLAKSQQTALEYETELELVAEKSHSHPELIRRLNLGVNWTNIPAGTILKIPAVEYPTPADKATFAVIHLAGKFLEAFDAQTNLLAHFPCSIAANVEKRPVGELHVAVVAPNPNYTFDPDLFPESPEAQQLKMKLILPPGPNNPVGVAWIGLDKTGYGIHGTPVPEQVGRTESHGCFRLANWDAEYLMRLVWIGMPVLVEP
jgi:lipoprotein-anchoring transpeptidase ErfK/SrfK